jgi:hypothetical protein
MLLLINHCTVLQVEGLQGAVSPDEAHIAPSPPSLTVAEFSFTMTDVVMEIFMLFDR